MNPKDNNLSSLLKKIILSKQKEELNVFLCGKKSTEGDSLRESIDNALSKYSRINVLYPEWLFANLLEQKKSDLMTLESKLARDVDKIVVPLESIGTICELGSFVMNEDIRGKLIIINDEKYKNETSFINKGPIRLIKQSSLGEVIFIKFDNKDEVTTKIENKFKYTHSSKGGGLDFSNLFTLTYLIGLIILIYYPIGKRYLEYLIRQFSQGIDVNLIDVAIQILIKKGKISSDTSEKEEIFSMTAKGIEYFECSFKQMNSLKLYYKIRNISLWTKSSNRYKFNVRKERARLLEIRE